jgi:hypothetical protein
LHTRVGIQRGAAFARAKRVAALLIVRDEEDLCPRTRGPQMSSWLREESLPFPSAVVLMHPEFEVIFLPCLALMAGKPIQSAGVERPGLAADTQFEGGWEDQRGIKEWLTNHMTANRSYKPTLDQLPLTRLVDIPMLRAANVPCFGTFERALRFLANSRTEGSVYP